MSALEDREAGPEPDALAYGLPAGLRRYELDWRIWRAIKRDGRLTNDELDARFRVLAERLGYPGVGLWTET